jgi:hypothetical protein
MKPRFWESPFLIFNHQPLGCPLSLQYRTYLDKDSLGKDSRDESEDTQRDK